MMSVFFPHARVILLFSTVDSLNPWTRGRRHHHWSLSPLSNTKRIAATPVLFLATSSISSAKRAILSTVAADLESATVEKIVFESGRRVTLIGTNHLSKESSKQVERIIQDTRPDVVMVEIDTSRLNRFGYRSVEDIGLPVVTADDIIPPDLSQDGSKVSWWKMPEIAAKNLFLDAFALIARAMLTAMYNILSGDQVPGGEFKAAIEAAKANGASRVVLGDRDSTKTIRRAAELALDSGDPWGALKRYRKVNVEERNQSRDQLKQDLRKANADRSGADLMKAVKEAVKKDSIYRERLFKRLENEVPEFTQAFINERDYIMAESIRREIEKGAQHVVGVVGLAHVPGMKRLLMKNNQLVQDE